MPNMANVTVKDINGSDVVFTAIAGSTSDRTPARWEATSLSDVINYRPYFEMSSRQARSRNGRVFQFNFRGPILVPTAVAGVSSVAAVAPFSGSFTLPQNVDATSAANMFYLAAGMFSSTLAKTSVASGYPPR